MPAATRAKPPKKAAFHAVYVNEAGGEGALIATFNKAKCRKETGGFYAKAVSTDGKFKMAVGISEFHGFLAEYEIELGGPTSPGVYFAPISPKSSLPTFASYVKPPFEAFGFGEILFREGGRLMGVGFGPDMFGAGSEGKQAVVLTGVVECEYAKKGKKGKG